MFVWVYVFNSGNSDGMNGNTYFEVEVTFNSKPVKCDYGVKGSPTWIEYEDVSIESVFMFNREWTEKELRQEFGRLADYIVDNYSSEVEWND